MWGTAGFVVNELKSNKKEFPNAILVADEDGLGLSKWQLEKENSAVIVTDPQGVVRYFKQGAMSAAEIESTLALVLQYIDEPAASPGGAAGTP
jgi:predicted transcriptional regulator